MRYDFDTPVNRRNTNSLKWDVAEHELPMWVADMDFPLAPEIRAALEAKLAEGVMGYSIEPESWAMAYVNWWKNRHNWEMKPEWLVFCLGVIPAVSSAVRKLTTPGEKVLIQTPVYNIFYNSILNNGRVVLESPLKYENGAYSMDFDDLEAKLADPQTSMMLLCNPQNPAGKIWDRETLERVGELCWKHHVVVVSDEIHCDVTQPGKGYIPFASVSEHCRENSITCIAPTKCFNIAGLHTAAVSVPNPNLRHKIRRGINTDEVGEGNIFSVTAAQAAFNHGGEWLDQLREYLWENRRIAAEFLKKELPMLHLVEADATYLLWVDCSAVTDDSETFAARLRERTGLYVSHGAQYGESGRTFLRINIACPRSVLTDGLDRLKRGTLGE